MGCGAWLKRGFTEEMPEWHENSEMTYGAR